MRKFPFDISVSENCIDANLEMVEKRDHRQLSPFPATGMVRMDNTRNYLNVSNRCLTQL